MWVQICILAEARYDYPQGDSFHPSISKLAEVWQF